MDIKDLFGNIVRLTLRVRLEKLSDRSQGFFTKLSDGDQGFVWQNCQIYARICEEKLLDGRQGLVRQNVERTSRIYFAK